MPPTTNTKLNILGTAVHITYKHITCSLCLFEIRHISLSLYIYIYIYIYISTFALDSRSWQTLWRAHQVKSLLTMLRDLFSLRASAVTKRRHHKCKHIDCKQIPVGEPLLARIWQLGGQTQNEPKILCEHYANIMRSLGLVGFGASLMVCWCHPNACQPPRC